MNRIISFFKSIPIVRIVSVFAASVLIFVATACSGGELQAKTLNSNNPNRPSPEQYVPKEAVTNPREGGMNQYSDVDPRANTAGAQTKAKGLLDKADRNLDKMVDSPDQYARNYRSGTPLGERVKRIGEDVGSSTEELTEGFAKGTQRGVRNLKENTQNATSNVGDSAKQATENVKQNTQDAFGKTKQAVDNSSNFVKDKSQEAVNNTRRALDKVDIDER